MFAAVAVATVATVALPLGTRALATRAQQAHQYHVSIGVDATYAALTVNKYVPDKLTIHPGDSVTWTNAVGGEPQTVTFGPVENTPALIADMSASEINARIVRPQNGRAIRDVSLNVYSSGALMSGIRGLTTTYTFTFPKTGTYLYRSLFHPLSLGEIDVVAASKPASSDTPDRGAAMYDAVRSSAQALQNEQRNELGGASYGGTTIAVGNGNGNVTINKFTPAGITIKAGSRITWQIDETSGDPHAIVLNPSQADARQPLYTGLASDGGLKINPRYTTPTAIDNSTITTDTARTPINSGILYGSSPVYPSQTPNNYSLTFASPGGYYYVDPFHPSMLGEIQVLP